MRHGRANVVASRGRITDARQTAIRDAKPNDVGQAAEFLAHHWPRVQSVIARSESQPDTLERIRIECTNYAVLAALLLGASLPCFITPSDPLLLPENQKDLRLFGIFCGISVIF